MLWKLITKSGDNLSEFETLLSDKNAYFWFILSISTDDGFMDWDEDDNFVPENPRRNLKDLQENVLCAEDTSSNHLQVFKERCLSNLHYLALIGLANSNFSIEEVTHLAIFMHETGLIVFSEYLSKTSDFELEETIDLELLRDFSGELMPYHKMIRKY